MSDTALDHPLVRKYLLELREALAPLPPQQAVELRDQIAAHIDEELPPGATDEEISDAVRRMGTPADIAREAGARPQRTLRSVIRRQSWKLWASIAAVVATASVLIGLLVSVESAPVLTFNVSSGWWPPQDWKHQVDTSADTAEQTTVPVRWHQQQGLFIQIFNVSSYTQTVLGYAPGSAESPGNIRSGQLGVSTRKSVDEYPGDPQTQRYTLPVAIPPGQSRYLRIFWTTGICIVKGGSQSIDQLVLRVRVGWITRTEAISLGQAWAVMGTAQSTC